MSDSLPSFISKGRPFSTGNSLESLVRRGLTSKREYERDGRIYAGQSGFCARQTALYSTFKGETVEGPESYTYMQLGNTIEDIVMAGLEANEAVLFKQYKLPDVGLNMGGYIDGVILHEGKIKLLEVKSCSALPGSPKLNHVAQARQYEAISGIPSSIFYFSRHVADYKGQLKIKAFDLNSTPEDIRRGLYNAAYARIAIDRGVIPPRPPFESKAMCGYCMYVPYCWDKSEIATELKPVTATQHREIVEYVNGWVDQLLDPVAVEQRRNGILKFLSLNGNDIAKRLLDHSDWSTFF